MFIISFWWDLLLCVFSVWLIFYLWAKHSIEYWKRKGVPGPKPNIILGNLSEAFTLRKSIGEKMAELYFENKHLPHLGIFLPLTPLWMVNDLDLVKRLMVKDFAHFTDRIIPMNEEHEPLSAHLFNSAGEKWKNMRAKLTPTFTTRRMKEMFYSLDSCAAVMMEYLDSNGEGVHDVKEIFAKYSTDVIGSSAFGLECNSFKHPDAEFRRIGKFLTQPPLRIAFMNLILFFVPKLAKYYKRSILGKEVNDFFYNTVKATVEYREKNGIVRNDFLQLLIQLKNNGRLKDEDSEKSEAQVDDGTRLTMMQLAAQVFVFFIAGFETSSTTASFALYELALNPDIQATLAEEIDKVLAEHDGKVTYDSLNDMTYMTKVIEETMRKYPALPILFRICTKEYKIPDTDIIIEKGTPVMIPIYGIQRDPEYYPNPNKFDPERFSPENKESRHHFAYLPFGEGPRICIGIRFGMMQTKLGLATILSKYEVSVCDKTKIPIEYDKKSFVLTSEGGVWLNLKKRVK